MIYVPHVENLQRPPCLLQVFYPALQQSLPAPFPALINAQDFMSAAPRRSAKLLLLLQWLRTERFGARKHKTTESAAGIQLRALLSPRGTHPTGNSSSDRFYPLIFHAASVSHLQHTTPSTQGVHKRNGTISIGSSGIARGRSSSSSSNRGHGSNHRLLHHQQRHERQQQQHQHQ